MSDPANPNIQKRSTPQWALYQRENFWKLNDGGLPPFNTGMGHVYSWEDIPADEDTARS
ncbi:L-lactate dehydrogenase [Aspergillus sclerotialis]|uniref:L-lactate dehydrogenase n=1 Tax=Aspergillus sclerotialis TaxID=2070753 RepID=A0A3A2Z3S0_9EURO|nr:L-lactate dehydrogenase [Aspergillus sclerotialis]